MSAETPPTALRRAPTAASHDHDLRRLCMCMGMGMGSVYQNFTAPVSDWVCGGLSGSESSGGAACNTGHRRSESAWPSAWRVLDTTTPPPPPVGGLSGGGAEGPAG